MLDFCSGMTQSLTTLYFLLHSRKRINNCFYKNSKAITSGWDSFILNMFKFEFEIFLQNCHMY